MNKIKVENLTSNPRNLMWAKHHFTQLEDFYKFGFQTNSHIAEIQSVMQQKRYYNESFIRIIGDSIQFECDCMFYERNDACGHILAAVMMYNSLRFDMDYSNLSFDQFEQVKYDLENRLRVDTEKAILNEEYGQKRKLGNEIVNIFNKAELSELHEILNDNLYHLEFDINISDRMDYFYGPMFPNISFGARIGAEKMYVIKNFSEFFHNVQTNREHRYGVNLNFVHSVSAFSENTQNIIEPLSRFYNEVSGERNQVRMITVYEENFESFFDLFKNYPSEYMDKQFLEAPFHIELKVEPLDNNEFKLSLNNEVSAYFTQYNMYEIRDGGFIRYTFNDNKTFTFCKLLIEEEYSIVNEKQLSTILNLLLESNKDTLKIDGYNYSEQVSVQSNVYIDVEDNDIIVRGEVDDNGHLNSIFDDKYKDDVKINKIKYLLESFMNDKVDNNIYMSLDDDKTYRFLSKGISYLDGLCTVYANESLLNMQKPASLDLNMGVTLDNGLLKVDLTSIKYSKEELEQILIHYQRKRKFMKLKNGEVINLEAKELDDITNLADQVGLKVNDLLNDKIGLPLYRSLQLENELSLLDNIEVNITGQLKIFNQNFKEQKMDDITVGTKYEHILKDYQKHGVKWMKLLSHYGFNGILADDMGLGKTLQVIALLEDAKSDKPSIVVAPASLLYNWQDELSKFDSNLSHIAIHGSKEERSELIKEAVSKDLIITTYDYLRNDTEEYENIDFNFVIIDEAQYIKNKNTLTARAVKTLKGENRIALTGTPIENTLAELWSIFDFTMPGYLYSYAYFRKNFEIPIVKDNDEQVQRRLRQMVEPFILRRIKQDVLKDLPDKIEKVLKVDFTEAEEKMYVAKLAQGNKEVRSILNSDKIDNIYILKLLTELRQLCIDPRLLYENVEVVSSKINAAVDFLENFKLTKQKTLLFSSFTRSLDLIELELKKRNISYYKLTGSNSKEERRNLVESFQNDDTIVFLISLKAAGVGLNLTAAENVIHFDPWWNVAAENQASDRAYRIGQTKNVQVIKLIMKDSLEEKILKMQQRKQEMADIFVEGASGSFASLSKSDILDLFNR